MKKWERTFYENDIPSIVKDEFKELLRTGKPVEEIADEITQKYVGIIDNLGEEPLFWLALADTQWNWGVLMPQVKERALYWLEKSNCSMVCEFSDVLLQEQVRVDLSGLKEKLLSPPPPAKKPRKSRCYQCPWNIGDVFALCLESDRAKEKGLYGRYFLIQKVDEITWYPKHIVPIVYTKITADDKLPSSAEEYNKLEYVQTSFTKYENRFWPYDGKRLYEDIAEKSKINYQVDDYGYLPEFRTTVATESAKEIPPNLIYIGNFQNITPPEKEFIPHTKENITTTPWKCFDRTFETKMIERYCNYNLRELSVYKR